MKCLWLQKSSHIQIRKEAHLNPTVVYTIENILKKILFPFLMRAKIENNILLIHHEDLPEFKKGGSIVRNSYFWALRSIAGRAVRYRDWEYEPEIWPALTRMLLSFAESRYLGYRETILEFPLSQGEIPPLLRDVSTWE